MSSRRTRSSTTRKESLASSYTTVSRWKCGVLARNDLCRSPCCLSWGSRRTWRPSKGVQLWGTWGYTTRSVMDRKKAVGKYILTLPLYLSFKWEKRIPKTPSRAPRSTETQRVQAVPMAKFLLAIKAAERTTRDSPSLMSPASKTGRKVQSMT